MLIDPESEIRSLQREIEILKEAVKVLTEALRLATEKDERAKVFVDRVEELLGEEVMYRD